MGKHIHLMGIGGSGMTAVAEISEKYGYEVSGCDIESSTAYSKNISVGHSKEHVKNADYVIVSPAVLFQNKNNDEVVEAKKTGKFMTWQEFVGKVLTKNKKVVCVAGTHGKSTTTAMLGRLLAGANLDPTVLVGARVPEWNGNARYGRGEYFVIEADEFNDNFLNYSPEIIILNNIEFDHPDYFKNEKQVFESFKKFINRLTGMKVLIINKDSEGIKKLIGMIDKTDLKIIEYSKTGKLGFDLGIPGKHNIANALGVAALGKLLGIDEKVIKSSLSSFKGIGRRMELIANKAGIEIYDDYAHHPTAIAASLQALRENHPKARIWAIDEPHGFSRTEALLPDYKNAFNDADKVLIGPIFKARDNETFGMTSEKVSKASGHHDAKGYSSFDEIKNILATGLKPGDVVLVMGAGKSYIWAREIAGLLPVSFADITTFHIGGSIKRYFEVRNEDEVKNAVGYAKKNKLPIFVIGEGSDILASDKNFEGVVIKYVGTGFYDLGKGRIKAEAGANWDSLVEYTVEKNLQGIECLSGIPGTVGASPIQNIGAYGQELKDSFESLTAFSIEKEKFVTLSKKDCGFGYRESVFKRPDHWQKFIIMDITLKLKENAKPGVRYESLKKYFDSEGIEKPTIQQVRSGVLSIRSQIFYDPKVVGNAGSFFKSPIVGKEKLEELQKKFPDIKFYEAGEQYKLPAGWLIEKAGWKGKTYKEAGVSPKHALILTNPHNKATAKEIIELSEKIIKDIKKKFGLELEREVQMINF